MKILLATIISSTLLMTGCTSTSGVGTFTMASTHNVRGVDYSVEDNTRIPTTGQSCNKTILWIFDITKPANPLSAAMDNAIRNGHEDGVDGDLLVNVLIQNESFSILGYSSNCLVVKGDLVRVNKVIKQG
jgi:hypothetical protein